MRELPIPPFFDPTRVGEVWRVPYQERADEAARWAAGHGVRRAAEDRLRICLVAVDVQNTFCIPGFELFVGGRSGDWCGGRQPSPLRVPLSQSRRHHAGDPDDGHPPGDADLPPVWLVNERGEHPAPFTLVSAEDVERGVWRFNEAMAPSLGLDARVRAAAAAPLYARDGRGREVCAHHLAVPLDAGRDRPRLGAAVEEAIFFHAIARASQPDFQVKGDNPLTEHYSVIGPEVTLGPAGETIAVRNHALVDDLHRYDAVIIAGQAKSHASPGPSRTCWRRCARAICRSLLTSTCSRTAPRPWWCRA